MAPDSRPDLRDLSVLQVHELMASLGERPFRARQVLAWLYRKGVSRIQDMTDLSRDLRARLSRVARLQDLRPGRIQTSADGTRKLLYRLGDGAGVEGVLIPEADHHTLCVSTQVGCRQGCAFCRTGAMGFRRNLSPAEITGQVLAARRLVDADRPLTNLVFMGMGEPLDNLDALLVALEHILGEHGLQMSQRKVTVSTVGLADRLPRLGRSTPAALAVSLNAVDDRLRSRLMPVNRRFPLAVLKEALAAYPLKPTRRITMEYVLLGGVNDRPEQARALARWLHGIRAKVNLIPYNPHPHSPFHRPQPEDVARFQQELIDRHVTALIRASRGQDIAAACGQLAAGDQED